MTLFIVSFSGTTWLQEITWQIYNGGKTSSEPIGHRVQFFDEAKYLATTQPDITTQPSPRLMKTHQPYHTIPKGASDATACKYIYVARNPKDVVVSYYKFESKMAPLTGYSGPFEFFAKMFLEGKSKLIKTRSIEKALNQHQFNHPTAVSDQFSLPDHSIKDIELISFEHRDSIHKAREGFLIFVGKILEPCGRNGRDETSSIDIYFNSNLFTQKFVYWASGVLGRGKGPPFSLPRLPLLYLSIFFSPTPIFFFFPPMRNLVSS